MSWTIPGSGDASSESESCNDSLLEVIIAIAQRSSNGSQNCTDDTGYKPEDAKKNTDAWSETVSQTMTDMLLELYFGDNAWQELIA